MNALQVAVLLESAIDRAYAAVESAQEVLEHLNDVHPEGDRSNLAVNLRTALHALADSTHTWKTLLEG